ncbi:MAG TPA: SIR2 family protein [Aquabacterium sp.]|uniref:SIR2 family NAD-dependent protein deacylase n=1 Tax=Aquabacterium sp. TaxID=1872578 RepID=UPI002E36B1D7|nr:SIR2 family protein [Aquabacterium sp.]HEX5356214.1 SIR2 family protein [Aquabacterium sp.]
MPVIEAQTKPLVAATLNEWLPELTGGLKEGRVVPYLGPGLLDLIPDCPVPSTPEALVALLTAKVTVPHKIRNRLTQAAQYIENFKHRKSVVNQMDAAFEAVPPASPLHDWIARLAPPLVVESWYDDTLIKAYAAQRPAKDWGQVQGLSQSEHFGTWTAFYDADGQLAESFSPAWKSLVYRPIGGRSPASNYLVSDSDYVEVLTEIDIQTPIPAEVQELRKGRGFLFMGCRFNDQLTRSFARQIMKRSGDRHWAVLPNEPTRMEARFMEENNVTRIDLPLAEVAALLSAS